MSLFSRKRVIFWSAALYATSLLMVTAVSPKLEEPGLSLTLFAADPDIVTPVGVVVGSDDKVYVIESHTHSPPSDYKGPKGDLVKVFVDKDKDGVADSFSVFAEGFNAGMNLAFSKRRCAVHPVCLVPLCVAGP